MVSRRLPTSMAAPKRGSVAARLARTVALLLLLVQALVVPAHRHASPAPSAAAAGMIVASPVRQRPDHPADCPVCREVAHAGQYLTPGDIALPAVPAVQVKSAVTTLTNVRADARSHAWRSRAPPVFGLS